MSRENDRRRETISFSETGELGKLELLRQILIFFTCFFAILDIVKKKKSDTCHPTLKVKVSY